ncbi:MAG: carboxymuconolactone decarboxylase family protein [Candidatus Omnitrophica bacterium]|nr:carboxymuconolactone decarboxylase family protein [Candidatus Omnitrophota bacterium]
MAIIRLMDESQATGRVKEIFEEIKSTLGLPFVPQLFRALGTNPPQLEAVWSQVKTLFASGLLDTKTKALAALAVAAAQRSPYFVSIHAVALKRLGATDEEIAELLELASLATGLNTLVSGLGLEPEL